MNHRSHKNALEREEKATAERLRNERQAAEEKLARERYFIGTELVLVLEKFAADCSDVAVSGVEVDGRLIAGVSASTPEIHYAGIEGDWRSVPEILLFRIRELPVLRANAEALIHYVNEQTGDVRGTLECRQYQYACLGLIALFSAAKLRRKCGLPRSRKEADSRTVFSVLWRWRRRLWSHRLMLNSIHDDIKKKGTSRY